MNKRIKNKKFKNEMVKFAVKVNIADELKEDSIAHLIKDYFTLDTIRNKELFKWDSEENKLLISKKCINHLLKICEAEPLEHEYNIEIVDEIKIFSK